MSWVNCRLDHSSKSLIPSFPWPLPEFSPYITPIKEVSIGYFGCFIFGSVYHIIISSFEVGETLFSGPAFHNLITCTPPPRNHTAGGQTVVREKPSSERIYAYLSHSIR